MTIRFRPLPFGDTNTTGRHDTKLVHSDEPVSMERESRRAYKKMLKAGISSCGSPSKKKKNKMRR